MEIQLVRKPYVGPKVIYATGKTLDSTNQHLRLVCFTRSNAFDYFQNANAGDEFKVNMYHTEQHPKYGTQYILDSVSPRFEKESNSNSDYCSAGMHCFHCQGYDRPDELVQTCQEGPCPACGEPFGSLIKERHKREYNICLCRF